MIPTLFAWILVGLVTLGGYPWAAWLLSKNPRDDGRMLTLLVGVAFSLGGLTLVMFWEAVFGLSFDLWVVTIPYTALMLPGWVLWRKALRPEAAAPPANSYPRPAWIVGLVLVLVSAAVLFNSVYWPFSRPDTLGIYARYGRGMWIWGTLVSFERDDSFYQTYPVLVPLTYTYSYLASGWQNEYLARVVPGLLSLGCLPALYVLGRMLYGQLAGLLSALFLALTPAFGQWASSGYVDLPMAFFYALSVLFAWRWWQTRHWTDALLAGGMMGLAAWTKNAALLGVVLLSIWLVWCRIKRQIDLRLMLISLTACAAVAAPWYIRNLLAVGMVIPPTAWIDRAQRTADNLLVLVTHPEMFGLSGWAVMLGLFTGFVSCLQGRNRDEYLLLVYLTVPFFMAWWLFVSYDPRFLLLILPLLAVFAGQWAARLWLSISVIWRQRLALPLTVLALVLAVVVAWNSVEYKDEILRNPLMGDQSKRDIVLGEQ